MKTLVISLALSVSLVLSHPFSAPNNAEQWRNFKNTFQKKYSTLEEDLSRQRIFQENLRAIEEHNTLYDQGEVTFKLGMNEFGDLTNEEFKNRMTCLNMKPIESSANVYKPDENEVLADSVDWRTKGAVTGVKNQGSCGGCWAFSATGSLEGQHFLKKGELVSLSEQNLIDCSSPEGNRGCQGGLMSYSFDYILKNGGIDTEDSYPFKGRDGHCSFDNSHIGATVTGYTNITAGSESDLQSAVANVGPVSVAIDASSLFFQFYRSGIYHGWFCSSHELDHGVLVVGYGSNKEGDYWIVKNSWGSSWGNKGYILMSRNRKNNCGIATMASYPNV